MKFLSLVLNFSTKSNYPIISVRVLDRKILDEHSQFQILVGTVMNILRDIFSFSLSRPHFTCVIFRHFIRHRRVVSSKVLISVQNLVKEITSFIFYIPTSLCFSKVTMRTCYRLLPYKLTEKPTKLLYTTFQRVVGYCTFNMAIEYQTYCNKKKAIAHL